MNDSPESEDLAERALARLIRDLPPRQAPKSLEVRVLAELQSRQSGRWWQRRFAHWPVPARTAFISACTALIGFTLLDTPWSMLSARVVNAAVTWSMSWSHPALGAMASAAQMSGWVSRVVPPNWLFAFLGLGALLYASLFGLGIAAYRTLYLSLPKAGNHR